MGITEETQAMLHSYAKLRGKSVKNNEFWDVVVITAMDEAQKEAYEKQLKDKEDQGDIPRDVRYLVMADPPGTRVGSGGATMNSIHQLHQVFGEELWQQKVLLINAGGLSQRLPSCSITGKIFTALPIEDEAGHGFDLLDYKLACFLPFISRMQPGVFHAAGDTIETFDLGENSVWNFRAPGFTALAHPSSLEIGTTHGVFVLKPDDTASSHVTTVQQCLKVLQKPTVGQMRDAGAVLKLNGEEVAYTDSNFFFDHDVSRKLLGFYKDHGLTCEIDAYGDFLQGLGIERSDDYVTDVRNVSRVESTLVETRHKLYKLFHDVQLNVLVMNQSKFYHVGTAPECLEHFCQESPIKMEMGLQYWACSCSARNSSNGNNIKKASGSSLWCSIHSSYGNSQVTVGERTLLEYCNVMTAVKLENGCYISHCVIDSQDGNVEVQVPAATFMYTASIVVKSTPMFVTVAMGIHDNVKKAYSDPASIKWFNKPLGASLQADEQDVSYWLTDSKTCNLWNMKLFTARTTPAEAFHKTLQTMKVAQTGTALPNFQGDLRISMADMIRMKDISQTLQFRKALRIQIEKLKADEKATQSNL